jgi:hypothetical protein
MPMLPDGTKLPYTKEYMKERPKGKKPKSQMDDAKLNALMKRMR